jgi:hypothetical protein
MGFDFHGIRCTSFSFKMSIYSNYKPGWTSLNIGNFHIPTKVITHGNELVDVSTPKKNPSPLQPHAKSLVVQRVFR